MKPIESKYFQVGALVDIITPRSLIAQKGERILEVHEFGIITTNNSREGCPVRFIAWPQIVDLEFRPTAKKTGNNA